METYGADHHLLFGLLALQNGIISRDQLVIAFSRWVADKDLELAQLLVDAGAIDNAMRQALVLMVQRHMERHQGDVAKSLAELSGSDLPAARTALEHLADPDLNASCLRLVPPETVFATTEQLGIGSGSSQRFRILRPLPGGRGGMGIISIARDEELGREVALKKIQPDKVTQPTYRQKFQFEAEVTGNLEHPGIIPVYSLGTGSDGQPFYAMRLVDGENLARAIEAFHRRRLAGEVDYQSRVFLQLIDRLIDVAQAIDYAHSRGVLHRDLKPGNILLGNYGETLVIDWGLARLHDPDRTEEDPWKTRIPSLADQTHVLPGQHPGAPVPQMPASDPHSCRPLRLPSGSDPRWATMQGSMVGTPGYASPEQVQGEIDRLGPASDIYALGAILYQVLTGQPPVRTDGQKLEKILEDTVAGRIVPPAEWVRDVPRGLSAIALRGLALRPEDRYATAGHLVSELERWKADEPLLAVPETAIRRGARWFRKHRGVAATAAAAMFLLTILAFTSAIIVNSFRLANQNLALENALVAQKERAAREDRERINKNLEQTLLNLTQTQTQLTTGFNDLLEKILKTPELQVASAKPVRVALMQMIPRWLVDLDKQVNLDESMLEQAAFILLRRANDWQEVFGSLDEQVSLLEPAVEYSDYLLKNNPQSAATASLNYRVKNNLASAYKNLNKLDEALAYYQDIIAQQRRLIEQYSAESQYQADLAFSHTNLANVYLRQGRTAEAVTEGNQALTILRRLVQDEAHQVHYSLQLSKALDEMGGFYGNGEDFPAAEKVLLEAIEVASGIQSVDQEIIERREKTMLDSRYNLSVLYIQTRRFSEAAALNEEIEKYWRGLIQKGNSRAKLDLAYSLLAKMDITKNQQQFDETRTVAAELELLLNECAAQDPSNLRYDYLLTKSILVTAQLDLIEDHGDSARKHLVLAVQQIIPWFLRHPDDGLAREILFQMVPLFLSAMSLEENLQREHVKQFVSDTPFAAKFADGPPERIMLYRALVLAALGLDEDAEQFLETVSMESPDRGRAAVLIAWLTAERMRESDPEKGSQELLRLQERLESLPAEEQAFLQRVFDAAARR